MLKCPLGDSVSNENNTYSGITTMTLSRRLTMHPIDSNIIAQFPNPNFQNFLQKYPYNSTRN